MSYMAPRIIESHAKTIHCSMISAFLWFVLWCVTSLFFLFVCLSFPAFRFDETTHLESHRRFVSTKHTVFPNELKEGILLAFYAETVFQRTNMISSNPSAFYAHLDAAASTKHTILRNPKGVARGSPKEATHLRDAEGPPQRAQRDRKILPKDFQRLIATARTDFTASRLGTRSQKV